MMLKTRYGLVVMSEHIECIDDKSDFAPYREITMASGNKHLIRPDELRKAFPEYK